MKNDWIYEYTRTQKLTVKSLDENRPWGGFYILEDGPHYDVKILWIRPRKLLSLQSHGTIEWPGHSEVWTALTNIRVIRGETEESLAIIDRMPGGIITIAGGFMHSLANPFSKEDMYVYEVRVSLANETPTEREKRIMRIYDNYGRGKQYPDEMLDSIMNTPFNPAKESTRLWKKTDMSGMEDCIWKMEHG